MNKAPQKILAGIGVATLLGSAALGFMIFKKNGEQAAARENFEKTAREFQRLRSLPLYPSAENLKKLEEQRDIAADAALATLKELQPLSIPLEQVTPEQFQQNLREMVNRATAAAQERGVSLPEDFYFGFDRYRTGAPTPAAASGLWRQARAIELAVNTLLESRVDAITSLSRTELPEESGKPAATGLIVRDPFTIEFRSSQAALRRSLNELTTSKKQFFIPRSVKIKNELDKPVAKAVAAPGVAGAPAEGAAENAAATGETAGASRSALQYLVGNEKLEATLNLEMVIFAESFAN